MKKSKKEIKNIYFLFKHFSYHSSGVREWEEFEGEMIQIGTGPDFHEERMVIDVFPSVEAALERAALHPKKEERIRIDGPDSPLKEVRREWCQIEKIQEERIFWRRHPDSILKWNQVESAFKIRLGNKGIFWDKVSPEDDAFSEYSGKHVWINSLIYCY